MKIRPVGAELFHARGYTDGRTDMKLIVAILKEYFVIVHSHTTLTT
jgi:hypothetical protein